MNGRRALFLAALLGGCAGGGLPSEESVRVERGKTLYDLSCAACHQLHGRGMEGVAPPLIGSPWALGSECRLIRISLQGVRGPINVGDRHFNLEMPGMAFFDDRDMADILSYVRRGWGHTASLVAPETVKRVRHETADRGDSWTVEELHRLP